MSNHHNNAASKSNWRQR